MRILFLSLTLCFLAVFLFSCFSDARASDVSIAEVSCVKISSDNSIYYIRDLRSDVMYMFFSGYRKGGLVLMVEPDGSPLTYSEWTSLYVMEDQ